MRGEAEVAVVIINPALSFNRAGSSRESPEIYFSQSTFKFSPPCFTCEVNTSGPLTFNWAQNDSVQFIKEGLTCLLKYLLIQSLYACFFKV